MAAARVHEQPALALRIRHYNDPLLACTRDIRDRRRLATRNRCVSAYPSKLKGLTLDFASSYSRSLPRLHSASTRERKKASKRNTTSYRRREGYSPSSERAKSIIERSFNCLSGITRRLEGILAEGVVRANSLPKEVCIELFFFKPSPTRVTDERYSNITYYTWLSLSKHTYLVLDSLSSIMHSQCRLYALLWQFFITSV